MSRISIIIIFMMLTVSLISSSNYKKDAALSMDQKNAIEKRIDKDNKEKIKSSINVDQFYKETRYVMSKEEIQIYKHLPDLDAKKEFIKDFWKKRDPTPGSDINENLFEYYRRVNYVKKYFNERSGRNRGLDSDRGKIYILLGEPDQRITRQGSIIDGLGRPKQVMAEIWSYDYYRLSISFVDEDGLGRYRIRYWSAELLSAIDRARFFIETRKKEAKPFKLKSNIEKNNIKVKIPTKTISFIESDDEMKANFKITLFVYHKYRKVGEIVTKQSISEKSKNLLVKKNIEFNIPLNLKDKGKYQLDLVVEELGSGARYREMIKYKY